MIQTTLFNYFTCHDTNESLKPKYHSPSSVKQTNLTQYFKTVPKKKNLILNYFKPKITKEKEEVFELVLVDLKKTAEGVDIMSVKKNMYDKDLKYITISYRWGEVTEQLVKTPDYIAHITSFDLSHLRFLCCHINQEPDLKEIPYLWVDAISINQLNHARKKETILKMSDIYKRATYILAVPDLHYIHLSNNVANADVINLIHKYRNEIYQDIYTTSHLFTISSNKNYNNIINNYLANSNTNNTIQHTNVNHSNDKENDERYSFIEKLSHKKYIDENEELRKEIKALAFKKQSEELKKAYQFLAFLIHDWANRVWVISEYQIAKQKYNQHGTPLKYWFLSLLSTEDGVPSNRPFLSYHFINQDVIQPIKDAMLVLNHPDVDDGQKFNQFLKLTFTQRNHLDMMIRSNATRNEDRFHAILPSWEKYKHLIQDKNTISDWNITDFLSVKLKLFEIMDDTDLWNKARLLYYSSVFNGKPILPTFATQYYYVIVGEIDAVENSHDHLFLCLSGLDINIHEKYNNDIKKYINDYYRQYGSIYKQNLIHLQFHKQQQQQQHHLSLLVNQVFMFPMVPKLEQNELSNYSLNEQDGLTLVFVPYFTFDIPELMDLLPLYNNSYPVLSGIFLLGNININRWIVYSSFNCTTYGQPTLDPFHDYIFNIY
ncbi:unnamed protein product [Cunninghamella blakesleeana]